MKSKIGEFVFASYVTLPGRKLSGKRNFSMGFFSSQSLQVLFYMVKARRRKRKEEAAAVYMRVGNAKGWFERRGDFLATAIHGYS